MTVTVTPTPLGGVLLVEPRVFRDERGFFLESYHQRALAAAGLTVTFVQDNHSRSQAGVLRGLHYQDRTAPMGKLVRCARGAVFDVAVDLRVGAPTFGQWYGLELSDENQRQLYIPPGFAPGFVTLSEVTDVHYKCMSFYTPAAEGGLRWDDPDLNVRWPVTTPLLSRRDATAPSLRQYLEKPAFQWGGDAAR